MDDTWSEERQEQAAVTCRITRHLGSTQLAQSGNEKILDKPLIVQLMRLKAGMSDVQLNPCGMVLPGHCLQSHRGGWIWSDDHGGSMTFGELYRCIFIHSYMKGRWNACQVPPLLTVRSIIRFSIQGGQCEEGDIKFVATRVKQTFRYLVGCKIRWILAIDPWGGGQWPQWLYL